VLHEARFQKIVGQIGRFGPRSRKSLSSNSWLGIIIPLHIPAVCRHIDDGIAALDQQFPKRLCVIDSAGKAAANSNDGDTVFLHKGDGGRAAAAAILKQFPSMASL